MDKNRRAPRTNEVWTLAEAYEPCVGRWSRLVAANFIEWLAIPPGSTWLDVGCGTGALSQIILQIANPRELLGIDAAENYIAFNRGQVSDARANFRLGDALSLPVETASYDAVISGLLLNFLVDPYKAATEMARVVKPGGTIAAYVWDYAGRMQFMRHFWNAAVELDPTIAALDEEKRFPLCNPEPLSELFLNASLTNVEVMPIDIWTVFKDFDDYWTPFTGGQGPAPGYAMSLTEEHRAALRERIHMSLPFALDGSIPLMARAWAVRGFRV